VKMLRCVVAIRPPFEVSPLLFLGIKILDKVEARRRELRLQDWKVKAGDHRFSDGSVRPDHSANAGRRLLGSERVTVEVREEEQTCRRRHASDRLKGSPHGFEREVRDDARP
jgi:hypothetical protein